MAKKSEFPKTIYVVREDDGTESYLLVHESLDNTVDVGTKRLVASYTLEQTLEASGHVQVKRVA